MDKKQILKIALIFLIIWGCDYFLKTWFLQHKETLKFGFISLRYTENHGIMLGSFGDLPLVLKSVFFVTTGIAIVMGLPLILALYSFKSTKCVYGLVLILAGIFGNVTDRIFYGYVIDYLSVVTGNFQGPILNFADIVQWFGYGLFFFGLKDELLHKWPQNEKRNDLWINGPYQIRFSISLLCIFLTFAITFTAFGYTMLKYTLVESYLSHAEIDRYLRFFLVCSSILLFFSSLVILLIGKIISYRIAGPSHAIKRYLQDTLEGKQYPLKFRENDHLKELEEPLTTFNQKINS